MDEERFCTDIQQSHKHKGQACSRRFLRRVCDLASIPPVFRSQQFLVLT